MERMSMKIVSHKHRKPPKSSADKPPTSLAQNQQREKEMEAYQQHIFLSEASVCNLSVVMVTVLIDHTWKKNHLSADVTAHFPKEQNCS